ncbi:MAG: PBP1A family penicillin-binding protein [Kofleriaceae bacterium]|nr:PBP1A family penicillin-binding protein [Kofleriaceae bacterium]
MQPRANEQPGRGKAKAKPKAGAKPRARTASSSRPPRAEARTAPRGLKARVRGFFTWRVQKRVLKWAAITGLALTALAAAAVAITFWIYARDPHLPTADALKNYHPKQVTRIVVPGPRGRDEVLGEVYTQRRTLVAYDDLPQLLVDAFVVAEDANFWSHGGVDYKGMVRAFFANLVSGKSKQGASTITQQVVKNLLLTPEKTFRRKMQEIILARRVEDTLSKKEILALYVNQIYFGHGRYGVVEAARFYFGKELEELNPGEIALLAGLPQAPEDISPFKNPKRAKSRQVYVLNQLVAHGKLDAAVGQHWADEPIHPVDDPFPMLARAPEVVDLVRRDLVEEHGERGLDTLGAEVRVTLRPSIEDAARRALQDGLRRYDGDHKVGRPVRKVAADKITAELTKLAKKLPKAGPKPVDVYPAVVTAVHDGDAELEVDLGGWAAALPLRGDDEDRYNPPAADGTRKKPSERFAAGDVVDVVLARGDDAAGAKHGDGHVVRFAPGPEGAVVVMDVRTRKVLALVGGFDVKPGGFNRATQAHRQPGSSFKPFVYATGLALGAVTAASIINDAPEVYDLWKPKNYASKFEGPVRLRYALAKSINTVAIRVCSQVSPGAVVATAHAMGIESELPEHLSLALGSGEVTPLELTNAFATFAAGGRYQPPQIIEAIDGHTRPGPEPVQALKPEVAYVVVDMMRSVVEEGTATKARSLKIPLAGKTGTSNDSRDAWFVGMTPDYVIGVWVGHDDNRPLGSHETGGHTALPVFVDTMKALKPAAKKFTRPPGVTEARIDKATGKLAPDGAPDGSSYTEVFLDGTVPTEVAPLPGEVDTTTFVTDEYGDDPEAVGGDGDDDGAGAGGGDDAAPVAHP